MPGIADNLVVLCSPRRVPVVVRHGKLAVALTSSPFTFPLPGAKCWAILGDWLPTAAPVGMFVTFRGYRPSGDTEPALGVHSVFAGPAMRGHPDSDGHTIPVAVGRWLFDEGYLTLHSPDRTKAGERWARAVGGKLPERDQMGSDDNALLSGMGALDLLNRHVWESNPWPEIGS